MIIRWNLPRPAWVAPQPTQLPKNAESLFIHGVTSVPLGDRLGESTPRKPGVAAREMGNAISGATPACTKEISIGAYKGYCTVILLRADIPNCFQVPPGRGTRFAKRNHPRSIHIGNHSKEVLADICSQDIHLRPSLGECAYRGD